MGSLGLVSYQSERKMMQFRPAHLVVIAAAAAGIVVPLAMSRETTSRGQIVPPGQTPTTPQPTVPCTPLTGCGRGPGTQRDVAYAWIDRYCNGDAVPTPPGFTTFALNYALGGQSSGPVQFVGVATINGVEVPTQPLNILNPGEKDVRIRAVEVPIDAVVEIVVTGTVLATGQPVIFGNGTTTRARSAAGPCPILPTVDTTTTTLPGGSVPSVPGTIVRAL